MLRVFKTLSRLIAVAIGVAVMAMPAQLRADFQLRVSTDNGSTWTTYHSDDGGNDWFPISHVIVGGDDDLTHGSVFADLFSIHATSTASLDVGLSTMDMGVGGTQQANHTYKLVVQTSITDVPTTPPPQTLSWLYTSSSSLSGSLSEHAQGWVDTTNALFGTSGSITTGSLMAPASGSSTFTATPPYSWTMQYTLSGSTTLVGRQISTDHNEEIQQSPAPAGLVLALSGVPVLAAQWVRRRRAPRAI
jgi:hypothetical protein